MQGHSYREEARRLTSEPRWPSEDAPDWYVVRRYGYDEAHRHRRYRGCS